LDVTPDAKGWNVSAIRREMMDVVDKFVTHVPQEHLGASWPQQTALAITSTTPSATNAVGAAGSANPDHGLGKKSV
jgi:hypothetical protein